MLKSNVIIVCGLNGVGKSTFGRALAEKWHFCFIDMEEIYFPRGDTGYIYATPRPFEEAESILLRMISEDDRFVLAATRGNFRREIVSHFRCAIYMEALKEIRIKRVYDRSYATYGQRMCRGGDLYAQEQAFFDFVRSRDENIVKDWLATLPCPVIQIDGARPIADNVQAVVEQLHDKKLMMEGTA